MIPPLKVSAVGQDDTIINRKALDIGQHARGERCDHAAQLGRLHTARQPLEQRKSEQLLEIVHHLGSAGLGQMNQFRCAVESR